MTQYTPGPWVAMDGYVKDSHNRGLAEVLQNRIANARLIAAAPALLEALLAIRVAGVTDKTANQALDAIALTTLKAKTND